MTTSVKFSKISAVILAAVLMLTLLTVNVFATEETTASSEVTTEVAGDETTAATDETTAGSSDTTASSDETTAHDHEEEEEDDGPNWDLIISLSIIGLLAVGFVVCYFVIPKFRDRVQKFFREYKSELSKVVWSPWRDVRQNTIIVIVVVVAFAIVIALLDVIFSGGINALGTLL